MKKLLWLDLNSSYAHASLALPAIQAQVEGEERGVEWCRVSATINSNVGNVVAEVVAQQPDVLAATAWLFTHEVLLKIVVRVKALLPDCRVIFGGPEFLGDNEVYLRQQPFGNCVFRGDGELGFHDWLERVEQPERWSEVTGVCWLDAVGVYHDGEKAMVKTFEKLKAPEQSPFFDWSKPFVQLETMRGCFNTCAFCVSGGEKPVRGLPVERVRERLQVIREHGIREIRLLDRTFNGNSRRAMELLQLFREFAGDLRFHLEIHPGLLTPEVLLLLREMPAGMLHLEAGIQSLHADVLAVCRRVGNLADSLAGIQRLAEMSNLVVHADLIAGLPGYSWGELLEDVHWLMCSKVGEIQVELLKLLPGTAMQADAEALGIAYASDPPYEVLRTREMSVKELQMARCLSRLVDGFYNASAWQSVMLDLTRLSGDFLLSFLNWLVDQDVLQQPLSLERRGKLLYTYCAEYYPECTTAVSVAWIMAGIPFTREPSGCLEAWSKDLPDGVQVLWGQPEGMTRLYRFPAAGGDYWFGFDRGRSPSKPLFVGVRSTRVPFFRGE